MSRIDDSGVRDATRRVRARSSKERAFTLARVVPARSLTRPRKWIAMRASHREQDATHWPSVRQRMVRANATSIIWCW